MSKEHWGPQPCLAGCHSSRMSSRKAGRRHSQQRAQDPSSCGSWKPAGVPLIWHLHDFLSARVLTSRVLPRSGQATLGIGVSEAVTRDARKVLPTLRLETVLNGVRTERFAPGGVPPADLDALAQLPRAPNGTVRLGLVATYASWKGHQLFLDAASLVDTQRSRFFIVGGPVYATRREPSHRG